MNYNHLPGLRWSTLKHGLTSPLALQHALANPQADSAAKSLGRAVHLIVLEGKEPPVLPSVCLTPSGSLSTGKEAKATLAQLAAQGIEAYTPADIEQSHRIAEAVLRNPDAADTLRLCQRREVSFQATLQGHTVKAQADMLGIGILGDLKTDSLGWRDERDLQRLVLRWGYHAQLAYYRAVMAAGGTHVDEARLVIVSSKAPHDVAVVRLGDAWMAAGDALVSRAMGAYEQVLAANAAGVPAPGAVSGVVDLDVPAWMAGEESAADGLTGFGGEDE